MPAELSSELLYSPDGAPRLDLVPERQGVALIELAAGRAYLGRARNLRRRLTRLLRTPALSEAASGVRYQPVGSAFEAAWLLSRVGRRVWPEDYRQRLRLRPAAFVKVITSNRFPRTTITNRLSAGTGLFFGPFRSRATAEEFDSRLLDFFGVRRCVENLDPSPDHAGCVYGEIGKCPRPCQDAISVEEYRGESGRLLAALESRGETLRRGLEDDRERASAGLEFEEAARLHERLRTLQEVLRIPDDAARELDRLHGVVIQRAAREGFVALWLVQRGFIQQPQPLQIDPDSAQALSLDRRVRALIEAVECETGAVRRREDDQALLTRWRNSSWRVGEYVVIDRFDRLPVRKIVNAISRVYRGQSAAPATNRFSVGG